VLFNTHFVTLFKIVLYVLLPRKSVFGGIVLLLGSIKSLHFLLKDLVDVCNINSLVGKLSSKSRQLVSKNGYLTFEALPLFLRSGKLISKLGEDSVLGSDVSIELNVVVLFSLKLSLVVFEILLLLVEVVLGSGVIFSGLVDQLISLSGVLNSLLPLEVELMSL
jgi:hypothetical protein